MAAFTAVGLVQLVVAVRRQLLGLPTDADDDAPVAAG